MPMCCRPVAPCWKARPSSSRTIRRCRRSISASRRAREPARGDEQRHAMPKAGPSQRKARSARPERPPRASFRPLKGGRKSNQVFEQISAFIRAGRIAPGSKLPAEREFADMFRASRQTIREAIYRVELAGLIETRHGTGSFVVATIPRAAVDLPLAELIRKEAHRTAEFFEIRRALEGWC